MDMEKVIKSLEICSENISCDGCEYEEYHGDGCFSKHLMGDALELLKAQRETIDELISADKALKLKEQETEWEHLWDAPDGTYKGRCKKCGFVHFFIENHDGQYRFCPSCGKDVKVE